MTLPVKRSFLGGRSMGEAVIEAREEVSLLLAQRKLHGAVVATNRSSSFQDFMTMRGAMLAGGLHCVRLRGGRGIEPTLPRSPDTPTWPAR
jgi:hypothetical protein